MAFAYRRGRLIAAGMALGLTLFYLAPIPFFIRLHGLLLFGVLALLRPDLALAFVPLTAPLYLIPVTLGGLRANPILLPLHEIAFLLAAGATLSGWGWRAIQQRKAALTRPPIDWHARLIDAAPLALFLLAGLWGSIIALPGSRAEALRELRWLVLEPLVFYLLIRTLGPKAIRASAYALIIAGTSVATIGLLQYVGLDLVPLIGTKQSFSENIVDAGAARRVASVYGHPNNLGLFLGRAWPLAAALALVGWRTKAVQLNQRLFLLAALTMLAGLFVSFSRGAWLGAVVAGAALAYGLISHTGTSQASGHSAWGRATIGLIAILAALSGLALTLRGGGGSEGVRLLLWREALGYIQLHPLGIGLDQFYAYHLPDSGRSLIDPSLIGTSEQYAAHPHNLLLDIWLRMGPLGLIAFGWLTFRLVRQGWAQVQTNRSALGLGALAALAAALTHGLVDQFYFVPDLACAYWVLLALAGQATPEETP